MFLCFLRLLAPIAVLLSLVPLPGQEGPARPFDFYALYKLKNPIRCLAVHPSGKVVLCGGGDFKANVGATFDILVVDTESGTILDRVKGHNSYVNAMAFDKDGKHFLAVDERGDAVIYAFGKKIEETVTRRFAGAIVEADLLGAAHRAALLVREKGIFIWDYAKDEIVGTIKFDRLEAFRMHPDGKTVVATTRDESLVFWEINSEKPKKTVSFKGDPPWSLALSPDGKIVALGHGGVGVVLVYSIDDFRKPIRLQGQNDIVHRLVFSPDGRYLFSGCELAGFGKNGIVAWDMRTREKILDYKHSASVEALQIWPNGDYVAAADQYGQLFLHKASQAKNKSPHK